MKSQHATHFGQQLILDQFELCLMSIAWLIIWIDLVGPQEVYLVICQIWLVILWKITFKHGVPHHVDVDHIVQDRNGTSKSPIRK